MGYLAVGKFGKALGGGRCMSVGVFMTLQTWKIDSKVSIGTDLLCKSLQTETRMSELKNYVESHVLDKQSARTH